MEQKKELIYITYVNADETELLKFAVYRVRRSKKKEYVVLCHRYTNWLYAPDSTSKTIFYDEIRVGTIREAVQALKQALKKHVTDDMFIEFLSIEDKNLQRRAGITFEEKLVERLEKIFTLYT